jgi:ribosomal-protein-serine acetyltransferase
MIGLDAGGGVLLAVREAHISWRIAQAYRRNAGRLEQMLPWSSNPGRLADATGATASRASDPSAAMTDEALAAYDLSTLRRLADGSGLDLAVVRDGEVLGVVSAEIADDGTAELGWWVDADAEGSGLAFRAVTTLAEHLIGSRGVSRLAARVLADDARSNALARRLGLRPVGVVSGVRAYAMSARGWRATHAAEGVELALAVDDELEMVLPEPRVVPALHDLTVANLDRLRCWEAWAQPEPDSHQTAAWWQSQMASFAAGEAYPMLPRMRGPAGALLGSVGATIEVTLGVATVGYWLDEGSVGKGVGRRCVQRLVDVLAHERAIGHIGLSTAVHNTRSRALAERCGFRFDRLLPAHQRIGGVDTDCVAYVHDG